MHCKFPEHHQSGGGGGALAAVVAVIIVIALIARPVAHAAHTAERVAVEVAEYLAIGVSVSALLGAAAVAAIAVHDRRAHARRALSAAENYAHVIPGAVVPDAVQAATAPQTLAIEARPPTLADVEDLAAAHGYTLVPRRRVVPGVIPLEIDDD